MFLDKLNVKEEMSYYHESNQSHLHDKHMIQLPKIIVQPGPSPFSSRKRAAAETGNKCTAQLETLNSNHQPDHYLNQNEIQIFQ